MKNELTPVHAGDILVLKSGEMLYVASVDPLNKMKQDDSLRTCNCRKGHIYKKGEQFKADKMYVGVVEDGRNHQVIAIDMSRSVNVALSTLCSLMAVNLGTVPEDKIKSFQKMSSDFYESQNHGRNNYW